MVNYCCVYGCGRNSRTSKHLYYHSVPKDELRWDRFIWFPDVLGSSCFFANYEQIFCNFSQEQWLIAAGREDLLEKPQEKRNTYRFCSRHFAAQSIKNKHLCNDATPSLHLPGSQVQGMLLQESPAINNNMLVPLYSEPLLNLQILSRNYTHTQDKTPRGLSKRLNDKVRRDNQCPIKLNRNYYQMNLIVATYWRPKSRPEIPICRDIVGDLCYLRCIMWVCISEFLVQDIR